MKSEQELEAVFKHKLEELEHVRGIRIWTDGEQDYMAWDTKPFLEPKVPATPDHHRSIKLLSIAFWILVFCSIAWEVLR